MKCRTTRWVVFIASVCGAAYGQSPGPDPRGVYVYSSDIARVSATYASGVAASLNLAGMDGIVLVIGWNSLEPAKGQYQWTTLDQWISLASSLGKKIDLTITAGSATPAWMFQQSPAGAGATPLYFTISPHSGNTAVCDSETLAAPWDPVFLGQWDSMLSAVATHLKSAGTYGAVTLLRLTGINRTTDELRLAAETPQSTGLACVSDAISLWQQAGYRPYLLLQAWDAITASFQKNFPDKLFSVAIIPQNPFPRIADDGSVIQGTEPDENLPLLALASQRFSGRLVVQFNFLMPGEAASPAVIQAAHNLGTMAAYQTNEYFGSTGKGAACSEPVTNPMPCTDATYLAMLLTGIYPEGQNDYFRSQYIEVFPANANAFPDDIAQAHQALLSSAPPPPFTDSGEVFPAAGGSGSIALTFQPGNPWTASASASWISFSGPQSSTGDGTLTFQVASNPGGDRAATITVGGLSFLVEQTASSLPGLAVAGSMAQVTSEGTWVWDLDLVNLGSSAGVAQLDAWDDRGNPLALPWTFPQTAPAAGPLWGSILDRALSPNAQLVLTSTGPTNVPTLVGWSQLLTTGSITGFGIFRNPTYGWSAAVPLETRNARSFSLAFDNTGALSTGVALANLAPKPANVAVLIRDDTGAQIGTATIGLSAQGHTSFMLNQEYPVTADRRGTIEFDTPSGGQISVVGLRANGAALTTLPVLANVTSAGGSITHATYNGGFTSTFYLVNTGTAPAQYTLSFFGESGGPMSIPLFLPQTQRAISSPALTGTLAAGAMLVAQTQGQDALASVSGSAQLITTGNISGFEVFRWDPYGQEASVPLETRTPNSFVLVFDDTNGLTTGVAVANEANTPANIMVNLRDDAGTLLQTGTIALAPQGHTAFMLPANYASTADLRGMAEFVVPTGGKISVIGLRAGGGGSLTTIPVLTK